MTGTDDPVIEMKRAVMAMGAAVPEDVWRELLQRWNAVAGHVKELRAEVIRLRDPVVWRKIAHDLAWSQVGQPHTTEEQASLDAYDDAVRVEPFDQLDEAKRRWAQLTDKSGVLDA